MGFYVVAGNGHTCRQGFLPDFCPRMRFLARGRKCPPMPVPVGYPWISAPTGRIVIPTCEESERGIWTGGGG